MMELEQKSRKSRKFRACKRSQAAPSSLQNVARVRSPRTVAMPSKSLQAVLGVLDTPSKLCLRSHPFPRPQCSGPCANLAVAHFQSSNALFCNHCKPFLLPARSEIVECMRIPVHTAGPKQSSVKHIRGSPTLWTFSCVLRKQIHNQVRTSSTELTRATLTIRGHSCKPSPYPPKCA